MSISTNSALTPWPRAASAAIEGERLCVSLKDGREVSVPVSWFAFLANASPEERQQFHLDEYGAAIEWNGLEDGISVPSLFGLPEDPPRTQNDTYVIDYRQDGRRWIAEIAELESWTWAPSLSVAKRDGRWLLAQLLHVDSLEQAGIQVVDRVASKEPVEA